MVRSTIKKKVCCTYHLNHLRIPYYSFQYQHQTGGNLSFSVIQRGEESRRKDRCSGTNSSHVVALEYDTRHTTSGNWNLLNEYKPKLLGKGNLVVNRIDTR